jgi:protein-disulfide isomerase
MITVFAISNRGDESARTAQPAAGNAELVPADSYRLGSGIKVTIVEFADFQCPACGTAAPSLERIAREYPQDVSLVFRHFPLPMHANALGAAKTAEAAGEQGKFWEMYQMLYAGQDQWSAAGQPKDIWAGYAAKLGLDAGKFSESVSAAKTQAKIQRDASSGQALGVNATPTIFINGRKLEGFPDYPTLKAAVEQQLTASQKP